MVILFHSVLNYIKHPRLKQLKYTSSKIKLGVVLQSVGLCLAIGIGIGFFTSFLEILGVYNSDTHAISKLFEESNPLYIIFTAVILAPVIEELIFRGPLTLFSKKYFKIGFYSLALIFGYVHLFNFEITTKILLFSPLLVLPQIVLGLVFGYIRVRFGLIYSILLHAMYNGVIIIPAILFMS